MKLSQLKVKANNPRLIKDDKFKKLVKSIEVFPKMLELRQIIYDPLTMEVLGGNMRLRALQELKYKDVPDKWVKSADDLTEDEKTRFLLVDNASFGEFDWDIITNEFEEFPLNDWGIDLPVLDFDSDYSGKNKEINTSEFLDKMELKFEVKSDEYKFILSELSKIDENKEAALLKLLNYES